MIQVRFDQQSPSRLGVVWRRPDTAEDPVAEARAAGLLFSILGGEPAAEPKSPGDDPGPHQGPRQRRKARAS